MVASGDESEKLDSSVHRNPKKVAFTVVFAVAHLLRQVEK